MLNQIISSVNNSPVNYTIISIDSGNVVSCVGEFEYPVICMGEYFEDVKIAKPKVTKTKRSKIMSTRDCLMSDDFGPQRFCALCGVRLIDVYEHMDNTPYWKHPDSNECKLSGMILENGVSIDVAEDDSVDFNTDNVELVRDISNVEEREEDNVDEDGNYISYGIISHKELTMDDIYDTYDTIKHTDWYKANRDILRELYDKCADDAGEDEEVVCNSLKEEVFHGDEGFTEGVGISFEETTHLNHFNVLANFARNARNGKGRQYIEKHMNELLEDNIYIPKLIRIAARMNDKRAKAIRTWIVLEKGLVKDEKQRISLRNYTNAFFNLNYIEDNEPIVTKPNKVRIIDVYEPCGNLREGFILQIDYIDGKLCNPQQWRILDYDRVFKFYYDKTALARKEGFRIITRNVRREWQKKFHQDPLYFGMWNMWLKNHAAYLEQVKNSLK